MSIIKILLRHLKPCGSNSPPYHGGSARKPHCWHRCDRVLLLKSSPFNNFILTPLDSLYCSSRGRGLRFLSGRTQPAARSWWIRMPATMKKNQFWRSILISKIKFLWDSFLLWTRFHCQFWPEFLKNFVGQKNSKLWQQKCSV